MRWVVELSAESSGASAPTVTVDGESWKAALTTARNGKPLPKYRCDFDEDGTVRVHDFVTNERFALRPLKPGADASPLRPATAATAAPAPVVVPAPSPAPAAIAVTSAPADTTAPLPLVPAPVAVAVTSAAPTPAAPASAPAVDARGATQSGPVAVPRPAPAEQAHVEPAPARTPTLRPAAPPAREPAPLPGGAQLVFQRNRDAVAGTGLTFRERVLAVAPGTAVAEAERVGREVFASLRAELASVERGQLVSIAVFDHVFSTRPERPPLVVLTWKDWRGDQPEVTHGAAPRASAASGPSSVPPIHLTPAPSTPPAATPSAPPVAPRVVSVPPPAALATPSEPPPTAHAAAVAPSTAVTTSAPAAASAPVQTAAPVAPTPAVAPAVAPAPVSSPLEQPAPAPLAQREPTPVAQPAPVPAAQPAPVPQPALVSQPASASAPAPAATQPPRAQHQPPPQQQPAGGAPGGRQRVASRPPGGWSPRAVGSSTAAPRAEDLLTDAFEATQDLSLLAEPDEACTIVAEILRDVVRAPFVAIGLYDIDRDELVLHTVQGGDATRGARTQLASGPRGDAAIRNKVVALSEMTGADPFVPGAPAGPALYLAARHDRRLFAVIEMHRASDASPFEAEEQEAAAFVAGQLGKFLAEHSRRIGFKDEPNRRA